MYMVSPNVWGPPIWIFFHTLTVKLKDDPSSFHVIGKQLFHYIKRLSAFLPCQECSAHSKIFFSRLPDTTIDSKVKLINSIYVFHNSVNQRKNKQLYKYEDVITNYNQHNLIVSYNNFANVYNTKGNLNQINESFHRKRLLYEFRKWLMSHIQFFNI